MSITARGKEDWEDKLDGEYHVKKVGQEKEYGISAASGKKSLCSSCMELWIGVSLRLVAG